MEISDTLSVNPGRTTLGALHPELNARFLRRKGMACAPARGKSGKKTLNYIFGINAWRSDGKSIAMLLIRLALSALLIVSGSFILCGEIFEPTDYVSSHVYALLEIISGAMLALGLFTRLAMGVATFGFAAVAGLGIAAGIFDMQALMSAVACLIFLVFGSGRYSCDFLLRKAIIIHISSRRIRRRSRRLSYRAFQDN